MPESTGYNTPRYDVAVHTKDTDGNTETIQYNTVFADPDEAAGWASRRLARTENAEVAYVRLILGDPNDLDTPKTCYTTVLPQQT